MYFLRILKNKFLFRKSEYLQLKMYFLLSGKSLSAIHYFFWQWVIYFQFTVFYQFYASVNCFYCFSHIIKYYANENDCLIMWKQKGVIFRSYLSRFFRSNDTKTVIVIPKRGYLDQFYITLKLSE